MAYTSNTLGDTFRSVVGKIWGQEEWIENSAYCVKRLTLNPGFQCSLHYHLVKKETFYVLAGIVHLEQRDIRNIPFKETLYVGEWRTIEPKTPHRFWSYAGATVLESSTHHSDFDVVRIVESGPIECTPFKPFSTASETTDSKS